MQFLLKENISHKIYSLVFIFFNAFGILFPDRITVFCFVSMINELIVLNYFPINNKDLLNLLNFHFGENFK